MKKQYNQPAAHSLALALRENLLLEGSKITADSNTETTEQFSTKQSWSAEDWSEK